MFFNSSKNYDLHYNNICVNVNTYIKNDVLDSSEEKLSQFQKKKSGFSRIELYIKFKYNIKDNPFRDEENNKLFRDQPAIKNIYIHNTN